VAVPLFQGIRIGSVECLFETEEMTHSGEPVPDRTERLGQLLLLSLKNSPVLDSDGEAEFGLCDQRPDGIECDFRHLVAAHQINADFEQRTVGVPCVICNDSHAKQMWDVVSNSCKERLQVNGVVVTKSIRPNV
jgi:hypothetical protein